jgi:hypothetical protein
MPVEARAGLQNRKRAGRCNTNPVFPWLEGLHDRMIGRVEMPGGMLILRIVTAPDMSTDETDTQMHPGVTHFQTLLTAIGARGDLSYLVEVAALFCHRSLFPFKHLYACLYSTNLPSMKICPLHSLWRVGKRTEGSFSQFELPIWK